MTLNPKSRLFVKLVTFSSIQACKADVLGAKFQKLSPRCGDGDAIGQLDGIHEHICDAAVLCHAVDFGVKREGEGS